MYSQQMTVPMKLLEEKRRLNHYFRLAINLQITVTKPQVMKENNGLDFTNIKNICISEVIRKLE